jgi:5-bromo-4-chloroindolyl phosphate hydrolysis protein
MEKQNVSLVLSITAILLFFAVSGLFTYHILSNSNGNGNLEKEVQDNKNSIDLTNSNVEQLIKEIANSNERIYKIESDLSSDKSLYDLDDLEEKAEASRKFIKYLKNCFDDYNNESEFEELADCINDY